MELESLTCNHCGAPLKVPESANFVTCNHCSTQLAIRRTDSVTFTQRLGEIAEKTDRLVEVVTQLARENKIASLDRRWELEKQRYMSVDKHGRAHLPSEAGAVLVGVIVAAFGAIFTFHAAATGAPGVVPLFGVLFILVGIGVAVYRYGQAKEYRAAHRRHLRRRADVARDNPWGDDETPESLLSGFENIPTPEDYLRDLQNRDSED